MYINRIKCAINRSAAGFDTGGATAVSIRGGFDKSSSPPLLAPMDLGRLFRFGTGHWVEGNLLLFFSHPAIRAYHFDPFVFLPRCFDSFLFFLFPRETRTDSPSKWLIMSSNLFFSRFQFVLSLVDPLFSSLPRFIRYRISSLPPFPRKPDRSLLRFFIFQSPSN